MRHGKKFNHLGRQKGHRKALLANMAVSLIEHKKISTTIAKAKALRQFVEPLITKSKTDDMNSRRSVFRYLQKKDAVQELFGEVASKVADRPGGYTRIFKTGNRLGDNAETCIIELVDFNENILNSSKTKKTRRRKAAPKKSSSVTEVEVKDDVSETIEDATVIEEKSSDNISSSEDKESEDTSQNNEINDEDKKDEDKS
jgi:large subunit ribosomal protein L17